jgi:hypothetical protein
MKHPRVSNWYEKNMMNKSQVDTIDVLLNGINANELTTKEALCIALIVGVQWDVKFEGVP